MRNNIFKKCILVITMFIMIIGIKTYSFAASYTISSSKSEVTVGDTFTVTVNTSSMAGKFTISGSSNITISGTKTEFLDNSSMTVTAKADSVGTAKITVTAVDVADYSGNVITGSKSCSVTIKEKVVTPPPATSTNTNTNTSSSTKTNTSKNTNTKSTNNQVKNNTVANTTTEEKEEVKAPFGISNINIQVVKNNEEKEQIELDKQFDINTYEYSCSVSSDIKTLDIQYDAKEYNEYVSISGLEEGLKTGENIVILKLSKEGEEEKIYTIKVNKEEEIEEENLEMHKEETKKEPITISMRLEWFILMQVAILVVEVIVTKVIIDIIRSRRIKK